MNPFERSASARPVALEVCEAAGELAKDARPRAHHHRAAARSGARRCRDQCRADAGETGAARTHGSGRAARRRLRECADVQAVAVARPGFVNLRLRDDFWRAGQTRAGGQAGLRGGGSGPRQADQRQYCSANPTGRCTSGTGAAPYSATRWPPAREDGLRGDARILHQRSRRAGRRAGALGPPPLPRGPRPRPSAAAAGGIRPRS